MRYHAVKYVFGACSVFHFPRIICLPFWCSDLLPCVNAWRMHLGIYSMQCLPESLLSCFPRNGRAFCLLVAFYWPVDQEIQIITRRYRLVTQCDKCLWRMSRICHFHREEHVFKCRDPMLLSSWWRATSILACETPLFLNFTRSLLRSDNSQIVLLSRTVSYETKCFKVQRGAQPADSGLFCELIFRSIAVGLCFYATMAFREINIPWFCM